MTDKPPVSPNRSALLVGGIGLVSGFFGAALFSALPTGLPHGGTDHAIHDYLMAHPEVLPEAVEQLRSTEAGKQIGPLRAQIEKEWPGAVLGNPSGKVVLVEFMDFACGYCRQSVADVEKLTAARPDVKVVIRQLPILSPESVDAAKWGLAAAEQGKYGAFHKAMYAAGHPDAAGIAAAAKAAGLDEAKARATVARPDVQAEIERNLEIARKLGLNGTPSWMAGEKVLGGAVGYDELAKALKTGAN